MTKKDTIIWQLLNVVCWIIFIGYCIQAGALIFNYIFSVFKPEATKNLYMQLDLSDVYTRSMGTYMKVFSLIIFLSILKAYLFYLVISMFMKLNLIQPFSEVIAGYITRIGYYTFSIGLLGVIAASYGKQLSKQGYNLTSAGDYWQSSEIFLLMSAIVFVIAMLFKKGIEMQKEQELTV